MLDQFRCEISSILVPCLPALPPTPAKTSLVERKREEKREKKEQKWSQSLQSKDKIKSFSMPAVNREVSDGRYNATVQENVLFENSKEREAAMNVGDAFEDPAAKDFWHFGKNREPALIRRESCCSSCGGALSYSNSFASTRRFSTVSIEVPNENFMKKSLLNRNSQMSNGDFMRNSANPFAMVRKEDATKSTKNRSDQIAVEKVKFERM